MLDATQDGPASRALLSLWRDLQPVFEVVTDPRWVQRQGDPTMCDFLVGNPHEMPLPGLVDALRTHIEPKHPEWFAYTHNDPGARAVIAASLRAEGLPIAEEDVAMTAGAFGALSASLRTLVDAGDEVVYVTPPWFFYAPMITIAGGVPVAVPAQPPSFDLPVDAIAAAITERTKAVLINTPHNPSGRIYPVEQVRALADVLHAASERNGRPVVLISDESYRRIVFDGVPFTSPASVYPATFLVYTYGKTLLAPGERMGYVALAPGFPDPQPVRDALFLSQVVGGWQFPNATLQHAIGDIEGLSIDIAALQHRRDRLVDALRGMGYETITPEGTFYVLVRSPLDDERAFCRMLADRDIFCLPGITFDLPGYFRISLTATNDMVERALPGFEAALKEARS